MISSPTRVTFSKPETPPLAISANIKARKRREEETEALVLLLAFRFVVIARKKIVFLSFV